MTDWRDRIERIRQIFRAKQGLPLDDDFYQGLIHSTDNRERTRLSTRNVYRHAYMDLLAQADTQEWGILKDWAEEERALFIAENGERALAFINAMAAKKLQEVPVTSITMQNQPTQQQPEKKQGRFHL